MSDAVEIYLCKAGQKLEEGKVVYSSDIYDKEGAAEDAERRAKIMKDVVKIAYYQVSASGSFRCMYTWNRPVEEAEKPKKKKKRKPPPKKGLLAKMADAVGLGAKPKKKTVRKKKG